MLACSDGKITEGSNKDKEEKDKEMKKRTTTMNAAGGRRSGTPGTPQRAAHHDLPLLDEVSELLQKEKTLYELKMLESKLAADEWKSKYEKLIGQVADTAAVTGNYHTYEIAADIETGRLISKIQSSKTFSCKNQNLNILLICF